MAQTQSKGLLSLSLLKALALALALLPFAVSAQELGRQGTGSTAPSSDPFARKAKLGEKPSIRFLKARKPKKPKKRSKPPGPSPSSIPTPLFAFGDSFLDTGNNNLFTPVNNGLRPSIYPWNIDYYPGSGRFSNGRVLPDFLAAFLKQRTPPPYLSLFPVVALNPNSSLAFGLNFASGGAGLLPDTNKGKCITFNQQVDDWVNTYSKLYSAEQLSSAVVLISVGANDFNSVLSILGDSAALTAHFSNMLSNFSAGITALKATGLTKFIMLNIYPIGCTPLATSNYDLLPKDQLGCIALANSVTTTLNSFFLSAVSQLVTPGIKWLQLDFYGAVEDFLTEPVNYGFANSTKSFACCGGGKYNGKVVCGLLGYSLCSKRNDHIWFDRLHLTERAYSFLAHFIEKGDKFVSCPGGQTVSARNCKADGYLL